jgi:hypothetical protein
MSYPVTDTESIGNFLEHIDTKINSQFNKLEQMQSARENKLYNVRNINIRSSYNDSMLSNQLGGNNNTHGTCVKLCDNIGNLPINNSMLYNYKEFHYPDKGVSATFSLIKVLQFN